MKEKIVYARKVPYLTKENGLFRPLDLRSPMTLFGTLRFYDDDGDGDA